MTQVVTGSDSTSTTSSVTTAAQQASPVNVSVFGKTIPVLFGSAQVLGAPFWAGPVVTNDDGSREVTFAAILGTRDPYTDSVELIKVWMDGNLAYTNDGTASNAAAFKYEFYDGNEAQLASPTIVAVEGADKTPAFRDRMYIVIKGWHVPEGAKFPEVTCEVSQHVNIEATRYVTQFTRLNGAFGGSGPQFVDVPLGYQWCVDYSNGGELRVFDINQEVELYKIAPLPWGMAGTMKYTPYYIGQDNDKLSVCDLYGNHCHAADGIAYGGLALTSAQPTAQLQDGSQFICTLTYGPNCQIYRFDPAAFTVDRVASSSIPGHFSGSTAGPCVLPTKLLAPNNDVLVAYAGGGTIVSVIVQMLNDTAVIGTRQVKYTDADGVAGGSTHNDTLTVSSNTIAGVADLAPVLQAYGEANYNSFGIGFIVGDPIAGAWIGVLMVGSGQGHSYWIKCKTVYGYLGLVQPGHTTSGGVPTPNPIPDMPTVQSFEVMEIVQVPLDYINFAGNAVVFNNVPDTETKVCFTQSSGLAVFDFKDGSYVLYQHGTFKDAVTGANYGTDPVYDSWAIWNDQRKGFFYRNVSFSGFTEPGFINMFQAPDNQNVMYVSSYLRSLSRLAGFADNQIEVDNIDDAVVGSILNVSVNYLDLVTAVCELFRIDIVESEGKIKFKRRIRGTDFTVDRVLTLTDLAPLDQSNSDDGTVIQKDRDATVTLPNVLQLTYLDSDNDFQLGSQTAKRTVYPVRTSNGVNLETLGIPIAMDSKTALYWTEFCLFDRWAEALTLTLRLSTANLDLEPGDYVQINTENYGDYTVKLIEVDLNADFSLSVQASTILALPPDNVNLNNIDVASGDKGVLQSTGQTGQFNFWVIDNFSPYNAVGGETEAQLYVFGSQNLAINMQGVDGKYTTGIVLVPCANGIALNAIGQCQPWALSRPDMDTVLNVRMIGGAPTAPTTDDSWRSGVCGVAIGSPGRWEFIYFRTATHNSDGSWTLAGLIRGQRGTDTVDARRAGETVLFVTQSSPAPIGYTEYTGRNARIFGGYTNKAPTDPLSKSQFIALLGGSVKPWAPVQVQAAYTGSDITITWHRRDRGDDVSAFSDGTDVPPMSETVESYDVDILAADGTVKRTYHNLLGGPTCVYLAADIASDGLDLTHGLHVKVYQNSGLVGRGYGRDAVCLVS